MNIVFSVKQTKSFLWYVLRKGLLRIALREDGWTAFRIEGTLDFSLIGIISKISVALAEEKIGVFVVSTFNTDYVLVKTENFENAKNKLISLGYEFI